MINLFKESDLFFNDFLERNKILLDYNFDKIFELYNDDQQDSYGQYDIYFNIFKNFNYLKNKIYIIYYILVLYLVNDEVIKNYCRYVIAIFSRYNFINYNITKNIILKNRNEILIFFDKLMNNKTDNDKTIISKFFLFILCFQTYF
jgi:hypothetical protein